MYVYSLEGFIDGTIPCPSQYLDNLTHQSNPKFQAWQRCNHSVMTILYASLIEEKMGEIVSFTTAYYMWHSLRRSYESSSYSLKVQLQKIRKDSLTITQYLVKFKDIFDKLSAISEPISHKDHISYILDGLGVEYNAFVTSIQNRGDIPTLEDVRTLLLSYDYRLERQNSVDQLNNIQANLANLRFNQNSNNRR